MTAPRGPETATEITCIACGKKAMRQPTGRGGYRPVTCGMAECLRANKRIARARKMKEYRKTGKADAWVKDVCRCGGVKSISAALCRKCRFEQSAKDTHPKRGIRLASCIHCRKTHNASMPWGCHREECRTHFAKISDKARVKRKNAKRRTEPWWRMRDAIGGQVRAAITKGWVYGTKTMGTFAMLGYTPADLVAAMQNRFEFGMGWHNYGSEWHVDHIEPLSWFKGMRPDQTKKAWALSNLRPRWANDAIANRYGGLMQGNAEKGNRYAG